MIILCAASDTNLCPECQRRKVGQKTLNEFTDDEYRERMSQ